MTRRLAPWVRRAVLLASFATATTVASCAKDESAGQLTVVIQTDFAMPKDLDYFRLEVRSDGMPLGTDSPPPLYRNDYPIDLTAPPELRVTIPATFAVYNTKGAVEPIAIRVSAGRKNEVRILRDALTSVPTDRNAMLRMYLQWLSDGSAVPPAAGAADPRAATSACPGGQTNIAGICTDAHLDVGALPDFDAKLVYGGANPASGVGFDVLSCFASPTQVTVDNGTCSFPRPGGAAAGQINVAIELPPGSDGVCNAAHCVVALDRQDSPLAPIVGWSLVGDSVQLPAGVCTRAAAVPAMRVVVSQACASKTSGAPACGPPSAATDCSIHGTEDGGAPPPSVVSGVNTTRLSLGQDHTCVSSSASIRCWGSDVYFQTGKGSGSNVPLSDPQPNLLPEVVTDVSAGRDSTCAIAGSVYCWGNNRYGERGMPPPVPPANALQAGATMVIGGQPPIPELVAVSSSGTESHACAAGGGITHCWGSNSTFQLGDTGPGGASVSTLMLDAKALALGDRFTCAVDTGSNVRCWGVNDVGQLGLPPGQPIVYDPRGMLNGAPPSTDVVAGADFACALGVDQNVRCWGNGATGVPTGMKSAGVKGVTAVQVDVAGIAAGDDFVCAILDGTPQKVRCWGNNNVGQLGTTDQTMTVQDPVLPTGFDQLLDRIVAGGQRACVIIGTRVACWGYNNSGQIDGTPSPTPELPHEVDYGL